MRIIAGVARGRRIASPEGKNTRPTLDRVREAMFGMVQFDVENADVLDLFAGSGALGLEALSRGAGSVVFCDSSKECVELVKRNCESLSLTEGADIRNGDCFSVLAALSREGKSFSLVLLDPPYEAGLYEKTIDALVEFGLLRDGCILLAEHPKRMELCVDRERPFFERGRAHTYGDVAVTKLTFRK